MATPIYEYNADSPGLTSQRDSAAVKEDYIAGFSDLVAFEKNTKARIITSIIEPFISTEDSLPTREGIDNYNNRILCENGPILNYTTDAINFTTIVNFSTNASTSAFWSSLTAPRISKVVMTSATSAMVSLGDESNAHDPSGTVYYTDDNFVTFTPKLSISNGTILNLVKHDTKDWWLAPTYQLITGGALDAQTLYGSFDGGDTWVILDTTTWVSTTGNAHTHMGRFYDDDTVYVTYGDGIQSRLVKLVRPDEWNGSDVWGVALTKITAVTQLSDFTIIGDKIHLRREGVDRNGSDLYIYDITNDTFDGNTFLLYQQDADDGKPYLNTSETEGNEVNILNNLYFTTAHDFGVDSTNAGLLVSNDGKNWSMIYRSTKGVRRISGFFNNQVVTTMYDSGGTQKLGLFPIPSVRLIESIKAEKGQTNLIGLYDGTGNDNWATVEDSLDSLVSVYSDSDRLYDSETGIKIVAADNSYTNPGQWILQAEDSATAADIAGSFPQRILSPQVNDYCVLSYDIKYKGYNSNTLDSILFSKTSSQIPGIDGVAVIENYPISNEWLRVFITWRASASDQTNRPLQLVSSIIEGSYIYNPNVVVKIQNVNYFFDTERVDLRSYIPKGDRADDYSIAPLTGLGTSWSVTFDWLPLNGNLAFPVDVVATLPIATIKGSEGQYLKLYWDRAAFDGVGGGMAFKLTDGTTTISLDTEQDSVAMSWLHNDLLKFGITSDGTNTVLYCFNPENGAIHGSAILSNTDATTNIDTPASISLGANDDETIIGTGAFANIRGFNSVLSAGEIEDVFDSVNPLIISGGRYGGGGYRQTLRPRYAGRGR